MVKHRLHGPADQSLILRADGGKIIKGQTPELCTLTSECTWWRTTKKRRLLSLARHLPSRALVWGGRTETCSPFFKNLGSNPLLSAFLYASLLVCTSASPPLHLCPCLFPCPCPCPGPWPWPWQPSSAGVKVPNAQPTHLSSLESMVYSNTCAGPRLTLGIFLNCPHLILQGRGSQST